MARYVCLAGGPAGWLGQAENIFSLTTSIPKSLSPLIRRALPPPTADAAKGARGGAVGGPKGRLLACYLLLCSGWLARSLRLARAQAGFHQREHPALAEPRRIAGGGRARSGMSTSSLTCGQANQVNTCRLATKVH